ncbi:MAG TPA: hypothetical protein VER55_13525, partial [Ardenticatenaceae bacterium]|nr:hypothetical protein [Ardenticatenaceae bacterium]
RTDSGGSLCASGRAYNPPAGQHAPRVSGGGRPEQSELSDELVRRALRVAYVPGSHRGEIAAWTRC